MLLFIDHVGNNGVRSHNLQKGNKNGTKNKLVVGSITIYCRL